MLFKYSGKYVKIYFNMKITLFYKAAVVVVIIIVIVVVVVITVVVVVEFFYIYFDHGFLYYVWNFILG